MTHTRLALSLAAIAFACVTACGAAPGSTPTPTASAAPAASPAASPASPASSASPALSGTVAETMNSGGYTYARLQTGQKDVWIAANEFPLKTGEHLTVAINMPMENFRSKTLNRDFPLIYFVTDIAREGETLPAQTGQAGAPALAGSHDPTTGSPAAQVVEPIAPAPGGMKIADIWAKRKSLSGKVVVVRGKVVKVNNAIMGKNWFHLQDGSGSAKDSTNDLTITSSATVNVGDIVTVSGTLATDKDFGAGYAYEAIVESATVTQTSKAAM